jgi:hypothetical protein
MLTFKGGGRSIVLANPFGNLNHGALTNNDRATNSVAKYLDKELKIDLHTAQQQSLVQALKDPAAWLGDKEAKIKALSVELAKPYYQDIKGLFEIRMRQIEIDQTGSSLLFQGVALESNLNAAMGAKFLNNLSGQNLDPSKEEFKNYYKEKQARKKAKRARKSEGK